MYKSIVTLLLKLLILSISIPAFSAELNLSVAASLRESVTELSDLFQKRTPGVSFKKNFGIG